MRQIKFRVWDKNRRGFLYHSRNTIDSQNLWLSLEGALTSVTRPNHEIENFIIQQFTGLKDVNGVDIYEGDFIEFIPDVRSFLNDDCIHNNWGHVWFSSLELGATVSFNHPYSEYSMSWAEILKAFYSSDFRKETKCEFLDFKVVGNIFEDKNK